jgi:DNA-binding NtrC family response regulator
LSDVIAPQVATFPLSRLLVPTADPLGSEAESCLERHGKGAWQVFLRRAEASLIRAALQRTRGNLSRTAALLGISRPTLRGRCHKYGLVKNPEAGSECSNPRA